MKTRKKPVRKTVKKKTPVVETSQVLQQLSDEALKTSETKVSRGLSDVEKVALALVALAAFIIGVTALS